MFPAASLVRNKISGNVSLIFSFLEGVVLCTEVTSEHI